MTISIVYSTYILISAISLLVKTVKYVHSKTPVFVSLHHHIPEPKRILHLHSPQHPSQHHHELEHQRQILYPQKVTARAEAFGIRHSYINGVLIHPLPLCVVLAITTALKVSIDVGRCGNLTDINKQRVRWYNTLPPRATVDTKQKNVG